MVTQAPAPYKVADLTPVEVLYLDALGSGARMDNKHAVAAIIADLTDRDLLVRTDQGYKKTFEGSQDKTSVNRTNDGSPEVTNDLVVGGYLEKNPDTYSFSDSAKALVEMWKVMQVGGSADGQLSLVYRSEANEIP